MLSILSSVRRSGGGQPAGLSCLLWKLRKIAGDLPPRAVGLACRELGLLGIRDVPLFEELAKRSQQLADALDMVAAVHVAQGFAAVGVQCESLMAALAPLLLAAASRAGGSCGLPAEAAEEREAVGSSTGSSPSSAVETEEEATDVYPKYEPLPSARLPLPTILPAYHQCLRTKLYHAGSPLCSFTDRVLSSGLLKNGTIYHWHFQILHVC
eukprot:GHVT01077403.1.p1 GENE.GHVT01077403.1~~GHVT01077403.1.p1  ORF type:complete len:211 (-),score=46.74 GHVT01077403.1:930-1562(-)